MNNYLLAIDPSGMGKSGIFYPTLQLIETINYNNWIGHFNKIKNELKITTNNKIVYIEDIKATWNKIGLETITTIKLIASIEIYCLENNIKYITVTSDQVKSKVKWFKQIINLTNKEKTYIINIKKINFCLKTNIIFKKNKWFYNNKKINAHERDAILIYYIGKEKEV